MRDVKDREDAGEHTSKWVMAEGFLLQGEWFEESSELFKAKITLALRQSHPFCQGINSF